VLFLGAALARHPWIVLPGAWQTALGVHAGGRMHLKTALMRWSADGTWDKSFAAVLADADAEGRIHWAMVSVASTYCRAHHHATGARTKPPRLPGKDTRPCSTAPMRAWDAYGAA
jgi:hypothetical protein